MVTRCWRGPASGGDLAFEHDLAKLLFYEYAWFAPSPSGGPGLVYCWPWGRRVMTTRAAVINPIDARSYVAARLALSARTNSCVAEPSNALISRIRKWTQNPKRVTTRLSFCISAVDWGQDLGQKTL